MLFQATILKAFCVSFFVFSSFFNEWCGPIIPFHHDQVVFDIQVRSYYLILNGHNYILSGSSVVSGYCCWFGLIASGFTLIVCQALF